MKTEIIEVEEAKKFKSFKVEITIESEDQAKDFFKVIGKTSGNNYYMETFRKLEAYLKKIGII